MDKRVSEIFGSMVFNDDVMRERLPKEVYNALPNWHGCNICPFASPIFARDLYVQLC